MLKLLAEYDQPVVPESREINLNRFIDFCGVLWKVSTHVQLITTTPIEGEIHYRSPVAVKHEYASFRFGRFKGASMHT